MGSQRIELSGQKFGKWTFVSFDHHSGSSSKWLCKCECGNQYVVCSYTIRKGQSKQCKECNRNELPSRLIKGRESFHKKMSAKFGNGVSAKNRLLVSYKSNARKRNLSFELSREEFLLLTNSDCHYCGQVPSMIIGSGQRKSGWKNGTYSYNGIDRIENSLGYFKSNCVPCCTICNKSKRNMSYEDFSSWIKRLTSNFGEKKCL